MALADEANRYIDEYKPWVLAKQEGADAQLHAVCTQALNLFRVLNTALKPVLPRTGAQAEAFLQRAGGALGRPRHAAGGPSHRRVHAAVHPNRPEDIWTP